MPDLDEIRSAEKLEVDPLDLAAQLLSAASSSARAKLIVAAAAAVIADSACVLFRIDANTRDADWTLAAFAGDISIANPIVPRDSSLFAPLLLQPQEAVLFTSPDLVREDYSHLQVSRSVASIATLPLTYQDRLVGALQVVTFASVATEDDLAQLEPLIQLATPSLLAIARFEKEKEDLLDSVHRMTQLYDLEKSLNATLDLDRVMALIPRKVLPIVTGQAVHLWLFVGDALTLMATAGTDDTVSVGTVQRLGEGYVAKMAEEGVPLTLADPDDPRLQLRTGTSGTPVRTAMLVPLLDGEDEVGVLEAVNKADGTPFDDDDEFFFTSVAETVSSALKNASLMNAERKLEILEALVQVSSEITSTLRLERLLQIIVNSPQNVLPYQRSAIALDYRGKLQLKAISGMASIPFGDAQVDPLLELVRWLATEDEPLHLRRYDDESTEKSDDLPEPIAKHFEVTGYRAIFTLPLKDDQGRVGLLLYESSEPDFLDLAHTEMIKILAGQATVAIRNALLYREVPLISLLEPLVQRKQALLRTSKRRRLSLLAAAAATALFLSFCPLPMRVTGDATVGAQHLVTVAAPVEGNVTTVLVHEGERVERGQVMATMNDLTWRTELAAAQGRLQAAQLAMQNSLARGTADAGADRSQVEYLQAEVARAQARIDSAQLRSPITGIVTTPLLENAAGEHLDAGAAFAQVLDLSSAIVNVAIPESDAALLAPGESAAIKLDSYPQRSWHGKVALISPEAQVEDGTRTFVARVPLANNDALLRTGMAGRAKLSAGYRPAGYVLLRRPALWLWQTLWNWFGW